LNKCISLFGNLAQLDKVNLIISVALHGKKSIKLLPGLPQEFLFIAINVANQLRKSLHLDKGVQFQKKSKHGRNLCLFDLFLHHFDDLCKP